MVVFGFRRIVRTIFKIWKRGIYIFIERTSKLEIEKVQLNIAKEAMTIFSSDPVTTIYGIVERHFRDT